MKKKSVLVDRLSTEEIFIRHNNVLNQVTFNYQIVTRKFQKATVKRVVSTRTEKDVVIQEEHEDTISKTGLVVYPEFAEFIFHLDGVNKRLFLYLLYYGVNSENNRIVWNAGTRDDFNNYCKHMGKLQGFSDVTIKDAMNKLAEMNVVLTLKKGLYLLNPLMVGGNSLQARQRLIKTYSNELVKQGKDPARFFYPLLAE